MRAPVIYVAGPYRAASPWLVEQNIRAAETWALAVAAAGAIPLCPHSMFRFFDKSLEDSFWLHGTAELLRRCDAIVMVNGWRDSKGSQAEHRIATTRTMPIFDAHDPPVKSYGTDAERLRKWIETKVMRG